MLFNKHVVTLHYIVGNSSADSVRDAQEDLSRRCSVPRSGEVSGCDATPSDPATLDLPHPLCILCLLDSNLSLHRDNG